MKESGIVYRNFKNHLDVYRKSKKYRDSDILNLCSVYILAACGDFSEEYTSLLNELPEELKGTFTFCWLPLLQKLNKKYVKKTKNNNGGGRALNFRVNIVKFFKDNQCYINRDLVEKINEWFIYLTKQNMKTDLKNVTHDLELIYHNIDTGIKDSVIISIINANMKAKSLFLDIDIEIG